MSLLSEDSVIGGEESNLSSAESIESTALGNNETMDADNIAETSQPPAGTTETPRTVRTLSDDTRHIQVEPKDVIEYEWPLKSGEKWFLQEQIGELLDIKSFSRKFPDLTRRKVEKLERDWLLDTYNINDIMNETQLRDLCAMRAIEIHDLMGSEYPAIHQEYQRVMAERLKASMVAQAKEMEAIANDSKRLAELRVKAMKSASDYNHELQATKAIERRHYWDIQTNIIQSSSNRWKKLPAKYTRPGPYPVAVILGQFQNYYKKFTPEEMRKLPLGTAVNSDDFYPVYREPSPQPITVTEREIEKFEKVAAASSPIKIETPRNEYARKSVRSSRRVTYADDDDDF
ncbi:unnamed protein product [Auanema sp. JU1783]|nr:unnamed protein product [Auanema sp. JU1783]